jgi:citrate synthase
MPLYPEGDPRGGEVLNRLAGIDGPPERLEVVEAVLGVARSRGFPPPNMDMGLGAVSYCAQMIPGAGQAMATFPKVAGWLAHAMEEYANPTRFRSRADYVGIRPASSGTSVPSPPGS